MADFEMKRGDTAPALVTVLRDRAGAAVDLSQATTVLFVMRLATAAANTTPLIARPATKATQSGPTLGQVTYQWQAGETNAPALYNFEFVVTWNSGAEQTFPTSGFQTVQIFEDLEFHSTPTSLGLLDRTRLDPVAAPRGLVLSDDDSVRAWLALKCAADQAPALSGDELDKLVELARSPNGGYRVNRAAAEGWKWKAGKAAGGFQFNADGTGLDKSMVMSHCLEMARAFQMGQVRSVQVDTGLTPYEVAR